MLPSKTINNETPVHRLLGTKPDYKSLRMFGCACWPNLRPYNKRKLAFRSTQCVFLGYSPKHKGFKCLEVSSRRVYISRDVVFDESVFPFQNLHPNAGARLRQEILLLDSSLFNSDSRDATIDDSPVTNLPATNGSPSAPIVVQDLSRNAAENLRQNGAQNSPPASPEVSSQNDRGSNFGEDSPTGSSSGSRPPSDQPPDSPTPASGSPSASELARSPSPAHSAGRGAGSSAPGHARGSTPAASSDTRGAAGSPVASGGASSADSSAASTPTGSAGSPGSSAPASPVRQPVARRPITCASRGIKRPKESSKMCPRR
jgi:hypothetical protein